MNIVNIEIIVKIIDYCNLLSELPFVSEIYFARKIQLYYLITELPFMTEK